MIEGIQIEVEKGIATVRLNRPAQHNALTPMMVAGLAMAFIDLGDRADVRAIVLTGAGRSFCAGADLGAMRAASDYDFEQNLADGFGIFDLMKAVDDCPKPVVGRVNGAAIGGGAGLVSCCDIVVAVARATFAFSEVRLGIVPAVISPFVLAKIGPGAARELFLTGERFSAERAGQIGLVGYIVPDETVLDEVVAAKLAALHAGAPEAQAAVKRLLKEVVFQPPASVRDYTGRLIASRRASAEGREGMSSFLEKRSPAWADRGQDDQ